MGQMTQKKTILFTIAGIIGSLLLVWVAITVFEVQPSNDSLRIAPEVGSLAPDFTLKTLEGGEITLSNLRGNAVLINFWASWCIPCREESPILEAVWREYQDQGVIFIGVNYVDIESEALDYISEFNITYINGPDLGTRTHDGKTWHRILNQGKWERNERLSGVQKRCEMSIGEDQ